MRGDQSRHSCTVPIQVLLTVAAAASNDVCAGEQVVAQIGMGVDAGVWYGDNYSFATSYEMCLGHLQVSQVPLVASDAINAEWLRRMIREDDFVGGNC